MKRLSLFAVTALFATTLLAACGGKSDEAKPSDEATPPAASEPAASTAPEAAAPAQPVEITDALVNAYLEYQKESMTILREYAEKSQKNLESGKGDVSKAIQQANLATEYGKEMDAKLAAKRKELGFTEAQFETLRDAASAAATYRLLYNQMGGDKQVAAMEAEQKERIDKLPAAERAAAQSETDEMMRVFRDNRDLVELRKKYGDTSWEVLKRHADTLATQQLELLQMGNKK